MTYQANHLLELIITVHHLTESIERSHDEDIWFFERYLDNLPIYYRLRQIESLTKAFGIYDAPTPKISHFQRLLRGSFLSNTSIESYPALVAVAKAFYEFNQYPIEEDFLFLRMRYIYPGLLTDLLKIHSEIYKATRIGLESFPERLIRYHILRKIDFQPVHQLICSILDPQKRSFSKSDLIQRFDFPDVDINQVEEEHRRNQPEIDFDDY